MIPVDENLSVLKALEYGGQLEFNEGFLYIVEEKNVNMLIAHHHNEGVKPSRFEPTKEGLKASLQYLKDGK